MKVNVSTEIETKVQELGGRLEAARIARNLSSEQAAALFGVSRVMLSKYERGLAAPGAGVLAKMLEGGFDVVYFLSGKTLAEHSAALTADEQFLLRFFRETDDDGRRVLKRAAREEALRAGLGSAIPGTVLARVVLPPQQTMAEFMDEKEKYPETARMKPKEKAAYLAKRGTKP